MATYNSDAVNTGLMATPYGAGQVVCRTGEYTVGDSALDSGSVLALVPIPAGAKLLMIEYSFSALGTSRVADIGDTDDADRYANDVDVSSAVTGAINCVNHDYDDDDTIQVTVSGGTIPAAAVVKINAYYKMKDMIEDEA